MSPFHPTPLKKQLFSKKKPKTKQSLTQPSPSPNSLPLTLSHPTLPQPHPTLAQKNTYT